MQNIDIDASYWFEQIPLDGIVRVLTEGAYQQILENRSEPSLRFLRWLADNVSLAATLKAMVPSSSSDWELYRDGKLKLRETISRIQSGQPVGVSV